MISGKRFLVIGAHPDDADIMFGGSAAKLIDVGHKVKFVSVANGDCGHFNMPPAELAKRRYKETQASAQIVGLEEYEVLPNHDCALEASMENRARIVKIIREFNPDIVISHRLCDYHADHRATAQLVQDAAYLIMVPLYCPATRIPQKRPVFAYSWDHFQSPHPFKPDICVVIDDFVKTKLRMLDCHESQFYEWLPWNKGRKNFNKGVMSRDELDQWLIDNWLCRNSKQADLYREALLEGYGEAAASKIKYLESLQISEYGRIMELEEVKSWFAIC